MQSQNFQFQHKHRIKWRPTIIRTINRFQRIAKRLEVNNLHQPPQEMVLRNQLRVQIPLNIIQRDQGFGLQHESQASSVEAAL